MTAPNDTFSYSNLSGRPSSHVLKLLARILPGVRKVENEIAPYAAAWHEHNLAALAAGVILELPSRNVDHAEDLIGMFVVTLPNLFCAFFSAIRGDAVELKTAPNMGILLSGRNALITVAVNFVLALIAKFMLHKWNFYRGKGNEGFFILLPIAIIIAGTFAWGRLGGLDFLAHYCLRFVLRRRGYIPRGYVRFLNYAATELGFLQKVGGGYVFMHRYLLEYFAGSEQSSSGAADFSGDWSIAPD